MISRRSLLFQAGLITAAGGAAWWLRDKVLWPEPKLAFGPDGSSGWLPFARPEPSVVIVEASLGPASLAVLIDSGAQSSVIDRGVAERLGLHRGGVSPVIIAYGISGRPQLGGTAAFDLQLGRLSLTGMRAAAFDLASVAEASGRDFAMILGQDVLKSVVADFDFPGRRVALRDPAFFRTPPGAVVAPATLSRHELRVPVMVENHRLEAVLDTGSSSTLALSQAAADTSGLLAGRILGDAPSVGFGGMAGDRTFRAATVTFGGRTYRDVEVHVYQPAASRIPPALLGVGALKAFRVILDLGAGRLHLIPAEGPLDQN